MEFLSKEGLTHLWSKLKPKFESLNSSTTANTSEIAVQKARIDSFVSLPSGSTTGDAELMDIRVKADGTTATSAGNAVREQVGELKNLSLTSACFSEDFATFPTSTDETRNGVTYTWNGYVCNVSGTATNNSFTNFWGGTNFVPEHLRGGAIIKVRTRSTDPNIYTRVTCYYPGGSFATLCPTDTDTFVFIPSDATGVLFRFYVNSGETVNGSITVSIYKVISNAEYVSNQLAPIDKELSTIVVPEVLSRTWVQGNINSGTGANSSSNAEYRIRLYSYIYADSRFEITVSNGLTIYVYKYSSDNYESYVGVVGLRLKEGTYTFEGGYYYKVVALFEDGRKIYPEDGSGITLTVYHPTDTTLSIAGKPADAGAIGDALIRTLSFKTPLLGPNDDMDTIIERGIYRWTRGGGAPQNSPTMAGGILIFVGSGGVGAQIVVTQTGYLHVRYNGLTDTSWCEWNSLRRDDIINEIKLSNSTSWGLSNILANANKIMSIKWTPVGNFPKTLSNSSNVDPLQFFPMTEQTGIPYSSVRDQDKAVGMDVSYRTFMTAVRDPNSVLYTRRSTVSNSASYYGTVCSGLVNVAMGLNLDLTNYYLSESDLFETVPMQSIQSGDMLWISGHCAMVKDVTKDDYGRIKTVTTMEEWRPLPRVVTYSSFESFLSYREGYIARRFKNVDGVAYEPIPYVLNFDEEESEITYPDVQTDHGDAAVFMVGEDVRINVIDQKNYTSIVVEHDGNTVLTRSTIVPFTIENVSSGLYTITATGDGSSSVSTFFVVDATGSFDTTTGEVTYSSTNATPVMVNVYDLPSNRKITCKPIILSDEERTAGHINVLEYMDPEYQNVKVTFMTPYGTAVWYSENHQKWLPI